MKSNVYCERFLAGAPCLIAAWLLLLCAPLWAADVTLSCTAPTQNTDGTPLTDLDGFKFYYGNTQGGPYPAVIDETDETKCGVIIFGLVPGDWFFVSTAYNVAGVESDFSNEASKTIVAAPPNPPANLTVSDFVVYTIVKQKDKFVLLAIGTVAAGTTCNRNESVNGHYVVPNDDVRWTSPTGPRPLVVVAKCS